MWWLANPTCRCITTKNMSSLKCRHLNQLMRRRGTGNNSKKHPNLLKLSKTCQLHINHKLNSDIVTTQKIGLKQNLIRIVLSIWTKHSIEKLSGAKLSEKNGQGFLTGTAEQIGVANYEIERIIESDIPHDTNSKLSSEWEAVPFITPEHLNYIIGRHGKRLTKLREESGAQISVEGSCLYIKGDADQKEKALGLLHVFVEEAEKYNLLDSTKKVFLIGVDERTPLIMKKMKGGVTGREWLIPVTKAANKDGLLSLDNVPHLTDTWNTVLAEIRQKLREQTDKHFSLFIRNGRLRFGMHHKNIQSIAELLQSRPTFRTLKTGSMDEQKLLTELKMKPPKEYIKFNLVVQDVGDLSTSFDFQFFVDANGMGTIPPPFLLNKLWKKSGHGWVKPSSSYPPLAEQHILLTNSIISTRFMFNETNVNTKLPPDLQQYFENIVYKSKQDLELPGLPADNYSIRHYERARVRVYLFGECHMNICQFETRATENMWHDQHTEGIIFEDNELTRMFESREWDVEGVLARLEKIFRLASFMNRNLTKTIS